jgi:hypothetical protein
LKTAALQRFFCVFPTRNEAGMAFSAALINLADDIPKLPTSMKAIFTFLFLLMILASCRSTREGCPATNSSGPKFKSSKFDWYKG